MSSDGEGFMEAYSSVGRSHGFTEETLNLSMTAKQPPSYDGKVSWLRYEELVDDWVTFTTIQASKGGLPKSRLTGEAHMYKAVLQLRSRRRSQLFQGHAAMDDPEVLRQYLKGMQTRLRHPK